MIVGFVIITVAFKTFKKKLSKRDMFCNITVFFEERYKSIKTMIDTGNLLREPITKKPVVVVEKKELIDLIPENILQNVENIILGNVDSNIDEYSSRFRVIPFTSLGKENGLLLGIKVDNVEIEYAGEISNIQGAIIGIYDKSLTRNNAYNALVGLDIINNKEVSYEYITNFKK